MLEVKTLAKKIKARSATFSRAGGEDLRDKVAFDQRHEGDRKESHMDVWASAFRQRREQSKGPEVGRDCQVWGLAATPAELKASVPGQVSERSQGGRLRSSSSCWGPRAMLRMLFLLYALIFLGNFTPIFQAGSKAHCLHSHGATDTSTKALSKAAPQLPG